ncbi:putative bifunctional diguanylate cyclase/phosphodiesterase [Saccharibacillus deserti]|uniref:putative bifunctional diguanylate cyclase/phosphodiesterase n=1 Tax=Saccharibacillus deserti TaxID=1634444 RepID=UPI0015546F20|nr:bifunctional diguanylate cyclase/phosphodiesterase [Saccharibacillus deserti]
MYQNRRFFYAGTLCYLAAYYVLLDVFRHNESVMGWLANLLNLIPAAVGAFVLWLVFRKSAASLRTFWMLMLLSCAAYALAMMFWLWDALSPAYEIGLPGPADYLWFIEGLLIFSALLLLNYRQLKGLHALRLLLDASIFMTTAIALSWIVLIEPLYTQAVASGDLIFIILNISYPVQDLSFLFLLTLLMLSSGHAIAAKVQQMLLGAVLLFIAADSVYLYLLSIEAYQIGSFIDPLWSMSLIAIACAGIESLNPRVFTKIARKSDETKNRGWFRRMLPYVSLGMLMVVMLLQLPYFNMIVLCCLFGILLVIVRQILTLAENDELLTRLGTYLEVSDHNANHDELTGLPNRRFFNLKLQETVLQAQQDRQEFAVVFMDFNRFKYINDTLGHAVGDRMLQEAAGRFAQNLPEFCFLARLGGDEFVILIPPPAGRPMMDLVVEEIGRSFEKPIPIENHRLHVSTSIGVAVYPANGSTTDELLKNADAAMYQSKKENNHKVVFFDSSIGSDLEHRMEIENDLNTVLERNELSLHYQLQIDAGTHKITGVEALLRWKHPVKGLISPADFIPIAEETGAINPIGEWVLRQACSQQKRWVRAGFANLRMSVNLSPRQLQSDDIVERILGIVQSTAIDPRMLVLEMTETFAVSDTPAVIDKVNRLRRAKIQLAIDDFGSGYASLKYLRSFKPSLLKIDRGFIGPIGKQDSEADDMVRAIIRLGQSLNIEVLAEGVETREQFDFLKQAGCSEMQGYLIGRPAAEPELTARLQQSSAYFTLPPGSIGS